MEKHLIVMSVDAMVCEDLALLETLPHFKALMKDASVVRRMRTIYPSLTHPVHASLMTGCPAGLTGVPNNVLFAPGDPDPRWYNRLDEVRCDTLFHAAKRAGLATASCRWPMTAGGFDAIDWLVPEVMDRDVAEADSLESVYRDMCTGVLFEPVIRPRLSMLAGTERHPAYEDFSMACAADIIRRHRPNLLLTHPGMVDHCRHRTGLFTPQVDEALRMTDEWLGMLMKAAEDAGIAARTSFAIVSDHGQMERVRTAAPNVLLAERGLIRLDGAGRVTDWRAWAVESGLSCQIHVRDAALEPELHRWLLGLCEGGLHGFGEVLTRAECEARYGLSGPFSFVLEGDGCTEFSNDWQGPYMRMDDNAGCGAHRASHGHMPERGPQPPMIVSGPAFRAGLTLESGSLLDEAPTFAAALGFSLPDAAGRPIAELLA